MSFQSLWLVGAGNMGKALLRGWLSQGVSPGSISIIEVNPAFRAPAGVRHSHLAPANKPDCIVLAVKPQTLSSAILPLVEKAKGALVVSIAAGKSIRFLESSFGSETKVVRAMPNIAATINKGITALCSNRNVTDEERDKATALFSAVGETCWVNEIQMDAVTALSGSGPAYIFYYLECIIQAGVDMGLDEELAARLALATMDGSVTLAKEWQGSIAELRGQVSSKGGTTEAALNVLGSRLQPLMLQALQAACERSKELSE